MGNRIFIELNSQDFAVPVVIYSHWEGEDILGAVTEVLSTTSRIDDASRLTAQIIHNVFKQCGYNGDSGLGVAAWETFTAEDAYEWADNPTIYVNLDNGSYYMGDSDKVFDRFGNQLAE